MKIALLQMVGSNQLDMNLKKGDAFCRKAKELGAAIAVFPEMWSVGYLDFHKNFVGDYNSMYNYAITSDSEFVRYFIALAQELSMAIAITLLERKGRNLYNTVLLIERTGKIAMRYAKVHVCSFDTHEKELTPGSGFKTATIETDEGPVRIGAMICFDREFPESARVLMLQGAEIVIVPNACCMIDSEFGDLRVQQVRARAFENMFGVAVANYAAPQDDGHSCAFTVDGSTICMADDHEHVVIADFNLKAIQKWQSCEVWGNNFRHPACYTEIVKKNKNI